MFRVLFLQHLYVSVLETLVVEVSFYHQLGTVYDVRRNLVTLDKAHLVGQVFPFAFLHTGIDYFGDTRPLCQDNLQVDLIVHDTVGFNLHVREQSMFPVPLDGRGNLITRQGDGLTHRQS